MSVVPNKSIVTYVGTFSPGVGHNSSDVQAAITAALLSRGLTVLTATSSGEGFFSIGTEPLTFTMQIEVDTGFDYGSETDVASIINNAIYQLYSVLPAASIPRVQLPASSGGGVQQTGQPGVTAPAAPAGCIAGSPTDTTGSWSISCWFGNLTSKGLSTVGLLAIVVAVGIGIFVFAPRPRVSVG